MRFVCYIFAHRLACVFVYMCVIRIFSSLLSIVSFSTTFWQNQNTNNNMSLSCWFAVFFYFALAVYMFHLNRNVLYT